MSLDTPTSPDPTDGDGELVRQEGIETTTEILPEPTRHGGNLHFVLNDVYRPARDLPLAPEDRELPDGSLYQTARARYLYGMDQDEIVTIEDSRGREREYLVLEDDYQLGDGTDRVAVSLNSSRCELGQQTDSGAFRSWFKYNLTLQPLDDDGEIRWSDTPTTSLNVVIRPQLENLAKQSNGEITENWSPPFGDGTEVIVQTTWAEDADEIQERALQLLEDTLGYRTDELDIVRESRRFWKAEVHHRIMEEKANEIAHVMRQSLELMARHEADIEEHTEYQDGSWQIVKLTSDGWEKLGFPILPGQEIEVKLYLPDAPAEYLEYPYDQPKVEVSLSGRPRGGEAYHADRWDQIVQVLEEILCSHLRWADVGTEHILKDDMSEGPFADPIEWEHPEGRRAWLRSHYESLLPELYAEARKADTQSIYDILHSIRRRGTATYDQIARDVGLTKDTVQGHVSRLCGPEDSPGLLKRIPDAQTFVTFSARFFEEDAHEALEQCYPNDTAEDRSERRQERVEKRFLKRTLGLTPADPDRHEDWTDEKVLGILEAVRRATGDDQDDEPDDLGPDDRDDRRDHGGEETEPEDNFGSSSRDTPSWELLTDLPLSRSELAAALDHEIVQEDHIQLRTDPYPTLAD